MESNINHSTGSSRLQPRKVNFLGNEYIQLCIWRRFITIWWSGCSPSSSILLQGTHTTAEENYEIYNDELGAIVKSLEQRRPECEGSVHPIKILTGQENLKYIMMSKLLNRRHTRWSEFLLGFRYKIIYRPTKQGQKLDALTRMPADIPPKCKGEYGLERLRTGWYVNWGRYGCKREYVI
jgi:hypothetical protein